MHEMLELPGANNTVAWVNSSRPQAETILYHSSI